MPGRAYHPQGWEASWRETARQVEEKKATYQAARYGLGHRVAILFEQRPEFVFHYFALNALGVGVVPVNPDYRRDETHYLVEHSEAVLLVVCNRVPSISRRSRQIWPVLADMCRSMTFLRCCQWH